ncbi:hypothetical protein FRB99_007910 [Tulasnella sp. 403]|nr:hypothetical protein FRB99_007910 [Tulasnella sp. 403]
MFGGLLSTSPNSPPDVNWSPTGSAPPCVGGGYQGELASYAPPPSSPPRLWSQSSSPLPTIHVQQDSVVFNIVLHAIYDLSCERYGPTLDTIAQALACLADYGITIPHANASIWDALTNHASADPIRVYSTAASYAADSVCIIASQYTLGIPLTNITEGDALTMGSIYLRRLVLLHVDHYDTLRRLLVWQPFEHELTDGCTAASRQSIKSAWQNNAADILLQDLPQNTTSSSLASVFGPLSTMLQCPTCKHHIQMRVATMTQDWAMAKRTI